jgi:hypothetical protein
MQQILRMFKKWFKSKKVSVNLFQNSFMRSIPSFFNFIKLFFPSSLAFWQKCLCDTTIGILRKCGIRHNDTRCLMVSVVMLIVSYAAVVMLFVSYAVVVMLFVCYAECFNGAYNYADCQLG